ncbi:ubiquitin-conjugating enzyme E2-34 kDa [Monosporozyma unispora]|nr:Ubiquitin-conjugating enzyme subunit [Kazachstania unispora]
MSSRKNTAASILLRQYRELTDPKKAIPSFNIELEDDSNIFVWNIGVMVLNEDSIYHGGYFKSQMRFPNDFPFSPPQFRFTPAIYHPNVYRDGRLCISILHQSGDPMTDEPDAETWSPVQTVESVLISIVSLLEDPNISSPANVDAAVDYRKNPEQYRQRVKMEVERSKQDIPAGFIMPTSESAYLSSSAQKSHSQSIENLNSRNDDIENNNNTSTTNNNNNNTSTSTNNNINKNISENFWYDSDMDDNEFQEDYLNDDVYNYKGGFADDEDGEEQMIEFEDDDEDDDSMDNDSVMDRKQPNKAGDESEDVEEMERVDKK